MLVPADNEHCSKCFYRTTITGIGYNPQGKSYCCDYMSIESREGAVKSRIFKNGERYYDTSMCDKFKEGTRKFNQTWEDTGKTFRRRKDW